MSAFLTPVTNIGVSCFDPLDFFILTQSSIGLLYCLKSVNHLLHHCHICLIYLQHFGPEIVIPASPQDEMAQYGILWHFCEICFFGKSVQTGQHVR